MKKLILLLSIVLLSVTSVMARDKVYRDASILPKQAQQTLKKAFPGTKVNRIKVDDNLLGRSDYEVVLDNGTEIEFTKNGEWKEVDCGHRAVPQTFIINPIKTFIKKNHKGSSVIKIDKDDKSYDIELNDGTELKFDRAGKFLKYDD